MPNWDERFRSGTYPQDPDPDPILQEYVETFPDGRALDVATGTGRNAVFLAGEDYEVDALDRSREGLKIARDNAAKRNIADRCNWIEADAFEYVYPENTYDVITIQSFQIVERLTDIKAALAPDGVLFYKAHMRTSESLDYGPPDRHRVAANELLRACLDLTVLHYREYTKGEPEHRGAYAEIIARNSSGHTQEHSDPRAFEA